ncbi:MAG TPA: hypothetical protein VFG79_23020 [Solirubrobacter sp.]|nr:hypothetical protein [Solirubrobacter sp.]
MTTLIDRIHAEIRERMERHRAAVEEYRRLEAALAVLDSAPRRPAAAAASAAPTLVEAQAAPESPAAEPVPPVAGPPSTDDAAPGNPELEETPALAA